MSIFITIIGLLIVSIISNSLINLIQNDDVIKQKGEMNLNFNNISLEENNVSNENLNYMLAISKILEENIEYINTSYYDLKVENEITEITTENILEDVSPQLLCLKLVHNITMMSAFIINYVENTGANVNNYFSKEKNLYLKIHISSENVEIVRKKGFGLFAFNIDDMAYALYSFYEGMKNYINELSKKKKFAFLNIITENYLQLFTKDPNNAMVTFIKNNKDFYAEQINFIKAQLEEK